MFRIEISHGVEWSISEWVRVAGWIRVFGLQHVELGCIKTGSCLSPIGTRGTYKHCNYIYRFLLSFPFGMYSICTECRKWACMVVIDKTSCSQHSTNCLQNTLQRINFCCLQMVPYAFEARSVFTPIPSTLTKNAVLFVKSEKALISKLLLCLDVSIFLKKNNAIAISL